MNDRVNVPAERSALVIGGSIAGLVAARVLTEHFDHVTIIERDQLPKGAFARAGAPQATHVHVLLVKGQQILENLFPGLQQELALAGAPSVDWTDDCALFALGRWGPRFRSGYVARLCTRDLLEWTLRSRLMQDPKVHFLDQREVVGLLSDTSKRRVSGVRIRLRNQSDQNEHTEEEIHSGLVVDASGRESHAPHWIASLGYPEPEETTVNSFLGYASRLYHLADDPRRNWKGLLIRATPPTILRSAVVLPVEVDRWMVTLGGSGRNYPPTDEEGFLEFARRLPSAECYDAIKAAKPLTPIHGYRRTENRLRHYERLRCMPDGLVVLGDAACAFNPIYGQGMTVAAQGALALDACLRERKGQKSDLEGLPARFQTRLAQVSRVPWLMATSADLLVPQVEGAKPNARIRMMHKYFYQVTIIALENAQVQNELFQVLHLVKPPSTLFQAKIVAKVLRRALGHKADGTTQNKHAQMENAAQLASHAE